MGVALKAGIVRRALRTGMRRVAGYTHYWSYPQGSEFGGRRNARGEGVVGVGAWNDLLGGIHDIDVKIDTAISAIGTVGLGLYNADQVLKAIKPALKEASEKLAEVNKIARDIAETYYR
jgi:hypothetical protein